MNEKTCELLLKEAERMLEISEEKFNESEKYDILSDEYYEINSYANMIYGEARGIVYSLLKFSYDSEKMTKLIVKLRVLDIKGGLK